MMELEACDFKCNITFLICVFSSCPPNNTKMSGCMIGENRQLVTNEPVEVQDRQENYRPFREIYRIYPDFMKENRRM